MSRIYLLVIALALVTQGCSAQPVTFKAGKLIASSNPFFGVHFPQGAAAVKYAYGEEGMWKNATPIEFKWNYYSDYADSAHPFNKKALIEFANGNRYTTARDANGHLLFDFDHSLQLKPGAGGSAFHEHNGVGKNGVRSGTPFTNFWYDDNFLARYMSQAYQLEEPAGLSEYADFTRWSVLGGGIAHWSPYHGSAPDQLALNGLFFFHSEQFQEALAQWRFLILRSKWDPWNQQYAYPGIDENYHLGLVKILTDRLLGSGLFSSRTQKELIQHSISLKSQILSNQEKQGDLFTGWTSSINDPSTLINIESISINVLALGTDSLWNFEPGLFPLRTEVGNSHIRRSNHSLSSSMGSSSLMSGKKGGLMTQGPDYELPPGKYWVEFFIRMRRAQEIQQSSTQTDQLLSIEISDTVNSQLLASRQVFTPDLDPESQWTLISLPLELEQSDNSIDIRTLWSGAAPLDLSLIRIKRQKDPNYREIDLAKTNSL